VSYAIITPLSLLMFDRYHIHLLIAAGQRDALRWPDRHPRFWCADSIHDFDLDPARTEGVKETASLDEWRELRRRRTGG